MLQRARRSSRGIDNLSLLNSGSLDEVERREEVEEEEEEEDGVCGNMRSGSSRRQLAKNRKFFFVFVFGLFVIG